jgi:hypothetical protein
VRLKPLDLAIALVAAGAIALAASAAYGPAGGTASAVLQGRDGQWVYPLAPDREVRVAGPLGDTIVEIRGKTAFIEDSPCPNKTCIAMGAISKAGQWVACLPNRVFVRIEGGRKDAGVDATVF